jgi:hypothetical protein
MLYLFIYILEKMWLMLTETAITWMDGYLSIFYIVSSKVFPLTHLLKGSFYAYGTHIFFMGTVI